MNQPEVLFEKKFVRFHRTFFSVRHIFTFMGLSTKFCHKVHVLPELLIVLPSSCSYIMVKSNLTHTWRNSRSTNRDEPTKSLT